MVHISPLVHEKVWLQKSKYDAAERRYYERLSQSLTSGKADDSSNSGSSSKDEVTHIESSLEEGLVTEPLLTTSNNSVVKPKEVQEESVCKSAGEASVCQIPSKPKIENNRLIENLPPKTASIDCACPFPTKSEKDIKQTEKELNESIFQGTNVSIKSENAETYSTKIDEIAVTSNTVSVEVANRVVALEKENKTLNGRMEKLEKKIAALEKQLLLATTALNAASPASKKEVAPAKPPAKAPAKPSNDNDDDDGVDLFGSDSEEEDAEAARIKEQRLAEYAARKSKKPALIAKSSIVLDVKPWDDETDMKLLEQEVRKIATDGLLWGASKLVPLAYGIHKLQISCVVEDEKVSVDWLQETIQEIEDYVQSVDIAAFNKI